MRHVKIERGIKIFIDKVPWFKEFKKWGVTFQISNGHFFLLFW